MKPQNNGRRNSWLVVLVSVCIALFALVITVSAPAGVAYAGKGGTPGGPGHHDGQGGKPDGTPKAPPDQAGGKELGKFIQREQHVLDSLDHRLDVSAKVAARAQEWIDKLNAASKDAAGLETGLVAFNAQVAEAKSDRDQAASLLAAHAGFDADGTVTDRQQALSTVRQIRELLRQAHKALVKAVPNFRHAVNDFRKANKSESGNKGQGKGVKTPEPTEQTAG